MMENITRLVLGGMVHQSVTVTFYERVITDSCNPLRNVESMMIWRSKNCIDADDENLESFMMGRSRPTWVLTLRCY